jgi:dTDP-4-amino-4,6-dideoxygalactose transaminase
MYYLVCRSGPERDALLSHLRGRGVRATFHYTPLHSSGYRVRQGLGESLPNAERFDQCLIRLPLFAGLASEQVDRVIEGVSTFFDV